jgi:hypothetical protein
MLLLGIISVGFDITDQLLISCFSFVRYWRKNWEYNKTVHQLFIDFNKSYDSVRKELLYNILTEFGVSMKLVRLIQLCLSEMYINVCVGKHLSDNCPIQALSKIRRCSNTTAFQTCFRICH